MLRLNECLGLRCKMNNIDMKISEIRGSIISPKIQVLSFAPSFSNGGINSYDRFLIKLETLQNERSDLQKKIDECWELSKAELKKISISDEHIDLLKLRFYYGLNCRESCEKMREFYPKSNWNKQKMYRMHKKMIEIIKNS